MRVLRFYAPRDVRVEDAPEPTAGPGDLFAIDPAQLAG